MQELHADKNFFDWLRRISSEYGDTMARWGQVVHDEVAANGGAGVPQQLIAATESAVDRLVGLLLAIGRRHDHPNNPHGADGVLDALDRLIGTSTELLRDGREGLGQRGLGAIAGLSPRIGELRDLESEVERRTDEMRTRLENSFGDPGTP